MDRPRKRPLLETRLLVSALLVVVMVGAVASDSHAQSQRLYGAWFSTLVELDSSPARFGELRRIWTLPLPPQSHPRSMVADGTGRYLLWPLATDLFVFDTASGELASYSLADGLVELEILGSNEEGDEWVIASRAVGGGSSRIVIFDARTRTSRANTLPGLCYAGFSYARTARMVFSLRRPSCGFAPPETGWVDSLDLADGRIRERIFDIPYGYGQAIATNAVGTRLWVGTLTGGFAAPAGYGVFEVATGALLAINTSVRPVDTSYVLPRLDVDEERRLVLSVTTEGLTAFDWDSLRVVGRADAPRTRIPDSAIPPGYSRTFSFQVLAHPDAAAIFTAEATGATYSYHGGPCLQSALIALDRNTGGRLAARELAAIAGQPLCGVTFAVAAAPARPRDLRASVSGDRVTLAWERPPRATGFEVEAGSMPGARNLAIFRTTDNSLLVTGVPPGIYHVRVRALNDGGTGVPSNDVLIVVK